MTSDGEITKIKVVDLDEFYNFIVYNLFIWNHLWFQKAVGNLIFKLLKNSNFFF